MTTKPKKKGLYDDLFEPVGGLYDDLFAPFEGLTGHLQKELPQAFSGAPDIPPPAPDGPSFLQKLEAQGRGTLAAVAGFGPKFSEGLHRSAGAVLGAIPGENVVSRGARALGQRNTEMADLEAEDAARLRQQVLGDSEQIAPANAAAGEVMTALPLNLARYVAAGPLGGAAMSMAENAGVRPEESTANLLAKGAKFAGAPDAISGGLERAAQSPMGRMVTDLGLNAGLDMGLRGAGALIQARATRQAKASADALAKVEASARAQTEAAAEAAGQARQVEQATTVAALEAEPPSAISQLMRKARDEQLAARNAPPPAVPFELPPPQQGVAPIPMGQAVDNFRQPWVDAAKAEEETAARAALAQQTIEADQSVVGFNRDLTAAAAEAHRNALGRGATAAREAAEAAEVEARATAGMTPQQIKARERLMGAREQYLSGGMRANDLGGAVTQALKSPGALKAVIGGASLAASTSDDEKVRNTGRAGLGLIAGSFAYPALKAAVRSGATRTAEGIAESGALGRKALDMVSYDIRADKDVMALVEAAQSGMSKWRAMGQELAGKARALGPEGDRALSDVIESEAFQPKLSPEGQAATAALATQVTDAVQMLGASKRDVGLISQGALDKYGSGYLRRMMGWYEAGNADGLNRSTGQRMEVRGEGMRKDLSVEQRNELGEIREASHRIAETFGRGGRDVETAFLFHSLAALDGVVEPSYKVAADAYLKASTALREAAAAGDRAAFTAAKTAHREAKAAMDDVGGMFREVHAQDRNALRDIFSGHDDEFVRLADTEKMGALRGAVVRKDVADYLNAVPDLSSKNNSYRAALKIWKKIHTVYNPGTHVGNALSNISKVHMAGLPVHEQVVGPNSLKAAWRDMQAYGPATRALAESGVLEQGLATYGDNLTQGLAGNKTALRTLARTTRPETAEAFAEQGLKPMGNVEYKLRKVDKAVERAYANGDGVFRVALYKKLTSGGMGSEQALQKVREAMPSYDTRSPILGAIKNTASPFILYPAKYIPSLLDDIATHPERWITLSMAWGGLDYASRKMHGAINEQTDLPPNQRSGSLGYLKPGRTQIDAVSRPVFRMLGIDVPKGRHHTIDVARLTPLSAFTGSPQPGTMATELGDNVPGILQPNGPIFDIASLVAGRDNFNGERLFRGKPLPGDKALAVGGKLAGMALPSALSFHLPRVLGDLRAGERGDAAVDALGFVGMRPQVVNANAQAKRDKWRFDQDSRDVKASLKRELRDVADPETRADVRAKARERLRYLRAQYRERRGTSP